MRVKDLEFEVLRLVVYTSGSQAPGLGAYPTSGHRDAPVRRRWYLACARMNLDTNVWMFLPCCFRAIVLYFMVLYDGEGGEVAGEEVSGLNALAIK